jgi:pimeloyl-ACP methyl ester carboxylesterase
MTPADARNGMLNLEERFAELKDVRLRYYVGGAGPPLVLVHGLGGGAANWVGVVPRLMERFRLLVPDLPGHGGSDPLPAAASIDPFAERVAQLAEREEMLPAAVVGHSFGGLVALRLALRRPEDVRALVLAASAGVSTATRRIERLLTIAAFVRPGRMYARFRDLIARNAALRYIVFGYWGASDPPALAPEVVEGFLEPTRLHTDTASAARVLVADDPRTQLELVRCPTLVLWGSRDHQVAVADAFEYARRLRAELRVVADCGHLLIGERPDACAAAVEDFLAGLTPKR